MSGGTRVSDEELLAAGAVLPPDTGNTPQGAVPVTARAYRHPGLDDRVVVRLVTGELGGAEDAAAAFLGLRPDSEPTVVGNGQRQSLGFPEWVLVHHPQDGHHALDVVPDLERAARLATSRPNAAMEAFVELGGRLEVSVPHFLPTFYEQAGRAFLAEESPKRAAQLFTRARKAEAQHGLAVDEQRLDAVFLEYALAGALPANVLAAYGRELGARVPADEALRRFTLLCLRRTAGGLPPSSQMANGLRKLARAARQDADLAEQAYLAELLGLPAVPRAPLSWWQSHREGLVALARRVPQVRGALLDLMPRVSDKDMPAVWLELLEASGATAGLCDPSLPAEERPQDGTAGWVRRFHALREACTSQRGCPSMPRLYSLLDRAADCLRTELSVSADELAVSGDVDLIDLLLSLGIPVTAPERAHELPLLSWAEREERRDLLALASDPRFRVPFRRAADDSLGRRGWNRESVMRAMRLLAAAPGGRLLLTEWVRALAQGTLGAALPQLPDELARLAWLPPEVLPLAEEEVRAAVTMDLAHVLTRTLRAGLLEELRWPALEEAADDLFPGRGRSMGASEAWPHLVVTSGRRARVIGAEGTVLAHDLRRPPGVRRDDLGFHYVDGELLVHWPGRDGLEGYWHTRADRIESLRSRHHYARGRELTWHSGDLTLPLPGGGRTTGHGILHAGDTTLPEERQLLSDGVSYWVWNSDPEAPQLRGWYAYDPATDAYGPMGMPAFLSDALREAPAGSQVVSAVLHPAPATGAGPAAVPVDGLVGLCVLQRPDGSLHARDLAGRSVTLPPGSPAPHALVTFPGDEDARGVVWRGSRYEVLDTDGVVVSVAELGRAHGSFNGGQALLPPVPYWQYLTPRDPEGSEALRRVDETVAAALLRAAAQEDTKDTKDTKVLPDAIGALLPVTDPALVAAIADVTRRVQRQQPVLDATAERLTAALGPKPEEDEGPTGPADIDLDSAMNGLVTAYGHRRRATHTVSGTLRMLSRATGMSGPPVEPGPDVRLHSEGPELPPESWPSLIALADAGLALAYRAAAGTTSGEHREVLTALLTAFGTLGLEPAGGSAPWRKVVLHLDDAPMGKPRELRPGLLPLPGGAFLALLGHHQRKKGGSGTRVTGFFHDPAGRFEVPEPYTTVSCEPLGEEGDAGRIGALLAALADRGPAPFFPEAAEEFARLTGVTGTMARLIVAGMPQIDGYDDAFLTADARRLIGVKAGAAALEREELRSLDDRIRIAVVEALLPAEPALLWTEGPDVAAAAKVFNAKVGKRRAVPEDLLHDAMRTLPDVRWGVREALPALLEPATEPRLSRDLEWKVTDFGAEPVGKSVGFTAETLTGFVTLAAWLAHRQPAGDPFRAALPAALTAVRERLDHAGLLLHLGRYVKVAEFRKVAGTPTETDERFERYGALIFNGSSAADDDEYIGPALRVALLDESGRDPYLPALRLDEPGPIAVEVALGLARDARFAALVGDPGDPLAGERAGDGTWWPQDPTRSVPDLVTEAAAEYGLGEDAAALYLMLLVMPDPTDRMTARWTGWKPARLKAARAELAATDLLVEAARTRAGRSQFLPGAWVEVPAPGIPLEQWKLPLFADTVSDGHTPLGVIVPTEPAAALYRKAWQRIREGDVPRFEKLTVRRGRRR
ncbi:DNA-binding protein [Streptomyces massasporeus]|uniref:DNA-binding protein n=1 Tax=Streptomyces massasporeus TaxID=67324 RepID=UPI0033CE6949